MVHLADLNPSEKSFSRTGRMSEALGGRNLVRTVARPGPPKVDLLKMLIGGDSETRVAPPATDEEAYERGEELCSSARHHPTAVKRTAFVSAVEKELAFARAMETVVPKGILADTSSPPPPPKLLLLDDTERKEGNLSRTSGSMRNSPRRKKHCTSAFLAVPRKAPTLIQEAPPVGHYHPRFNVTDLHQQTAFITKGRAHSSNASHTGGHSLNRHRVVGETDEAEKTVTDPFNATMGSVPSGTPSPMAASEGMTHANSPSKQQTAPPAQPAAGAAQPVQKIIQGTSAFLSRVPKGGGSLKKRSKRPVSVPLREELYNDTHFHPKVNRSNVRFDRQVSRADREKSATPGLGSTDLAYYPKLEPFHSPAHSFDSAVPRDKGAKVPRTSHDVPTALRPLRESNVEQFRYPRQPCIANIASQTSRDALSNNLIVLKMKSSVGTSELQGPARFPIPDERHKPSFQMAQIPARKEEKPRLAQDVIYDPDYTAVAKHWPNTLITATPDRPKIGLQGCETVQIPVGAYRSDSPLLHRKLAQNIEIARVVSREQREHVATGHIDKISSAEYHVSHNLQDKRVGGDPRIATHMSRETRMKLTSPTPQPLDKSYDWDVDKRYPSLHLGAVEFQKQVHRALHAGNAFANELKHGTSPEERTRARSTSPH